MTTTGPEAVELARMAGLTLDDWQAYVLVEALGERSDGKWAASNVGLVVPRQNGKGGILEAREIAGLFLLGERLIIHSAHQFDTSIEAFRRLEALIMNTDMLRRRVARVSKSHGEEGIELLSGQRIRFRTRTSGGGRGFSADCLILDEAMILAEAAHAALRPTMAARPNPQIWYTGSAVDQRTHEHGTVFAGVRHRGIAGGDPRLAFFEWSAPGADPDQVPPEVAGDPEFWAMANPALGIRMEAEYIADERASFVSNPRGFAVERLGIGDWPRIDGKAVWVIPEELWRGCADPESTFTGPPVFAIDVTPDRSFGTVGVAGRREDGLPHIEIVDHEPGADWLVERCAVLRVRHAGARFVVDPRGPAASLIPELLDAGVPVEEPGTADYVRACSAFADAVGAARLRYQPPQPELDVAIAGAKKRPVGDDWAWSRRSSATDISPLVAVTLALWGLAAAAGAFARVRFASDALSNLQAATAAKRGKAPPQIRVLTQEETTVLRVPPKRP